MKIELDSPGKAGNRIDAYTVGQITIANQVYQSSLLVSPDSIVPEWAPQSFAELTTPHIEQIITLAPEIVILGTGKTLTFPDEKLMRPIAERYIGFEIMDTGAACRSYNFLVSEGRQVVAALIMITK